MTFSALENFKLAQQVATLILPRYQNMDLIIKQIANNYPNLLPSVFIVKKSNF